MRDMQDKIYLLSIADFFDEVQGGILMAQSMDKVDERRREKAERIKRQSAKAACVGAGLLLQVAMRDVLEQGGNKMSILEKEMASLDIHSNLAKYSVCELLEQIEAPFLLEFVYSIYVRLYRRYNNISIRTKSIIYFIIM